MNVWFHGVTPERKVAGIQALRRVGQILAAAGEVDNEPPYTSLNGAQECWMNLARTGSQLLGFTTDDAEVMERCTEALDRGGIKYSTTADNEFPARPRPPVAMPEPQPEPEAEHPPEFYEAVAKVAMVLMATTDGSSGAALTLARTLQRQLPADPLWPSVAEFIMEVFPPMSAHDIEAFLQEGPA